MDHRWAMYIAPSSTGNTAMDDYKDSVGIVVTKKNSTADEPGLIKAPWRPWANPAHAQLPGGSPAQMRPAVRVPEPRHQPPEPTPRQRQPVPAPGTKTKTVDQLGPVHSTAQVSSTKDEIVDQLEEQPSRLHHTLLGLASRGLIRQDLLQRLLDLEGKQVSRDKAGCVRGSSSTSLSTLPSTVSAGLVEWPPPSSSSEGGGLAQFGLHASRSKRGYSQPDRVIASKPNGGGMTSSVQDPPTPPLSTSSVSAGRGELEYDTGEDFMVLATMPSSATTPWRLSLIHI